MSQKEDRTTEKDESFRDVDIIVTEEDDLDETSSKSSMPSTTIDIDEILDEPTEKEAKNIELDYAEPKEENTEAIEDIQNVIYNSRISEKTSVKMLVLIAALIIVVLVLVFFPGFSNTKIPLNVDIIENGKPLDASVYVDQQKLATMNGVSIGKHDLDVIITDSPVKEVSFSGAEIYNNDINIEIGKTAHPKFSGYAVKDSFFFNSGGLSFDKAEIKAIANGAFLFKCTEWIPEDQICKNKKWKKVKALELGEEYSVPITLGDPAFIEADKIPLPILK